MFESLQMAPPDPILGLNEAFKKDPNAGKINLSIGVYKDAAGHTPILDSVKAAETRMLEQETTKGYLDIHGSRDFAAATVELLFGRGDSGVSSERVATAQTPGGTGALRVAAEYLKTIHPQTSVYVSGPSWPIHPKIFKAAGLDVGTYPYFDQKNHGLAYPNMIETLEKIPTGSVVVLHGCCHNPTGVEIEADQWKRIGALLANRHIIPLVDFAYQGFATGIQEDAEGLRILTQYCDELFICSSYSKNFALYNERVGALTILAREPAHAQHVLSHVKSCIRATYSNPPAHGAAIVSTIIGDSQLKQQWEQELARMRDRINSMRHLFVETTRQRGLDADFSFVTRQKGMFSLTGLSAEQIDTLRHKHAVYIVGNSRLNVAGMTEENIPRLVDAIANVL